LKSNLATSFKIFNLLLLFIIGCESKDFLNPNDPANVPLPLILLSPTGDTLLSENPTRKFVFIASPGAFQDLQFKIELSQNRDFSSLVYYFYCVESVYSEDTINIDLESSLLSIPLLPEKCFWRVRAKNKEASDESWSEYSSPDSFRLKFPVVGKNENIPFIEDMITCENFSFFTFYKFLYSMDISHPEAPGILDNIELQKKLYPDIEISKDSLFVATDSLFYIISKKNPSQLELIRAYLYPFNRFYGYGDFEIISRFIILKNDYQNCIYSCEISSGDTLTICDTLNSSSGTLIESAHSHLLIAKKDTFEVWSLDNSGMFQKESSYPLEGSPKWFRIRGDTLYYTYTKESYFYLSIIDISSVPTIHLIGEVKTSPRVASPIIPVGELIAILTPGSLELYSLTDSLSKEGSVYYPDNRPIHSIENYLYIFFPGSLYVIKT
jgi:hypothetical protein